MTSFSVRRLLTSIGISLAIVLVPFVIFKASPGYATMALASVVWNPGIWIVRFFIASAPARTPGIDYIVAAVSIVFYTALLHAIFWIYDANRQR